MKIGVSRATTTETDIKIKCGAGGASMESSRAKRNEKTLLELLRRHMCLPTLPTNTYIQIVISISSQAHVNFYTVQNAQLEITTHKHKLQVATTYFL